MQLSDIYTILTGISGFSDKVAYNAFPAGMAPELPFICYLETGSGSFAADGVAYHTSHAVAIELYTDTRELTTEALVEAALTDAGLYYDKSVAWLDDEKCFEIIYKTEV